MEQTTTELEDRARKYQTLLCGEGFAAKAPEWDDRVNTWDISVKFEGIRLLVMLDADDPTLVRVMLPGFWEIEPAHLGPALVALDVANKRSKLAKVFLNPDRTDATASADFLDDGTGVGVDLLVRYLSMVTHVAKTFVSVLKEEVQKQ